MDLLKDGDATPQPTRPPAPQGNRRDIREAHPQERTVGDSQQRRSLFFPPPFHPQCKTKATAPALLTALARGSCRGIAQRPSASPTPGMLGVDKVPAQHRPASPPQAPPGRARLPLCPKTRIRKASDGTRVENHLPGQVSGRPTFLPGLHSQPLPQGAPRARPLRGGQGGGIAISRAIKHRWYFPCSIKT